MCKNIEIQNTVIEQAKEDADKVFAIYEQGNDLVGDLGVDGTDVLLPLLPAQTGVFGGLV